MPETRFSSIVSVGLPHDQFASVLVRQWADQVVTITVLIFCDTSTCLASGHAVIDSFPSAPLCLHLKGETLVIDGFQMHVPEAERARLRAFLDTCDATLRAAPPSIPAVPMPEVSHVH